MSVVLQNLVVFLIGFSIISAILLTVTHFSCSEYKGKILPRLAGIILLAGLVGLQISHFTFLQGSTELIHSKFYSAFLFMIAPAFYFFSRDLLKVENKLTPVQLLHLLPLLISAFLPHNIALLAAFFLGTGYVVWLAKTVYELRSQRTRFKLEMLALGVWFIVAVLVLILGIAIPVVSEAFFFSTYALLIGLAFFVAALILLRFPDITAEVSEAAQAAYAESTLKNVDSLAVEKTLQQLMIKEKVYTHENLSLGSLAEQLELTPHQLSEFINTHFNKSFSRYIREHRVAEARRLLIEEPHASVLSVGLSTGFTSQSNFYTAFREITGMAPGYFRKTQVGKT